MKYPDYVETESGLQYKVMHNIVKCKRFMVKQALFLIRCIQKTAGLATREWPQTEERRDSSGESLNCFCF